MFKNFKRKEITAGALRAKAKAKGINTAPKFSGGSKPVEDVRPITSGAGMEMLKKQAAERSAA